MCRQSCRASHHPASPDARPCPCASGSWQSSRIPCVKIFPSGFHHPAVAVAPPEGMGTSLRGPTPAPPITTDLQDSKRAGKSGVVKPLVQHRWKNQPPKHWVLCKHGFWPWRSVRARAEAPNAPSPPPTFALGTQAALTHKNWGSPVQPRIWGLSCTSPPPQTSICTKAAAQVNIQLQISRQRSCPRCQRSPGCSKASGEGKGLHGGSLRPPCHRQR